ncbi:hypothetical protein V6U90_30605 [Micromonospora sp. CPCC 206060]
MEHNDGLLADQRAGNPQFWVPSSSGVPAHGCSRLPDRCVESAPDQWE